MDVLSLVWSTNGALQPMFRNSAFAFPFQMHGLAMIGAYRYVVGAQHEYEVRHADPSEICDERGDCRHRHW
jgi:hypothetical protein